MSKLGPALIIAAFALVVLLGMWWAWRRRTRRDAGLRTEHDAPATLGALRTAVDTWYVATTEHERPLERIALTGLAFRAKAHLAVHDAGILLTIPGEPITFVPADRITAVGRATTTIDRVVERDGLLLVCWRVTDQRSPGGEHIVDSYLRPIDPLAAASIIDAVAAIAPTATVLQNDRKKSDRKRGAA
jgi:hypothetical protein